MKFYLVNCKDHGWIFFDEHLCKEEKCLPSVVRRTSLSFRYASLAIVRSPGGRPSGYKTTNRQTEESFALRQKNKASLILVWDNSDFSCPTCKQVSAEKLTLNSPFQDVSL